MIARCRTGELGTVVYRCEHCQRTHSIGRSCGNRHCPACQQHKTKAWLADQTARLLPCPYFLLTFTLPASLRRFVRSHQRACYGAMFRASSATIRTLAADPKYVGSSNCGFFGVLHTWGRTLGYHPHIHYVVPGGAVSEDGTQWLSSRANFFIPVKAASAIYRAKFCDEMRKEGLLGQIPPSVWQEAWVVHSQAVGDGKRSLKYLAPYVFRVIPRSVLPANGGTVSGVRNLGVWSCLFPAGDGLQSTGSRSAPCGRKHQKTFFPRRG